MGILDRLLKKDRAHWFVCYTCMMQTGNDTEKSIFYSEDPPVLILGRPWQQCPRCNGTNTKSFQQLKDEGSGGILFGLERIARKHPRSYFEAKPASRMDT